MPRENIAELVDEGSFKEYWPLVVARQHQRHDMETLRKRTPADGVVGGTGTINADLFGDEASSASSCRRFMRASRCPSGASWALLHAAAGPSTKWRAAT